MPVCDPNRNYDFEDLMALDVFEKSLPITYTVPIGQKLIIYKIREDYVTLHYLFSFTL